MRTPSGDDDTVHMQHRARVENTFGEFKAAFHATCEVWRHDSSLQPPTIILAGALYNYKKRQRAMEVLGIIDQLMDPER